MVEYLKAENRILRDKLPERLTVTPREPQRLIKLGRPLGSAIKELMAIVSPRTFARWLSGESPSPRKKRAPKPGRPRTEAEVRSWCCGWRGRPAGGYSRILGELRKLGVRSIARSTVANILKEANLDPGPNRVAGTWDEFVKRHAQTMWACDFFSRRVWKLRGLADVFVLFFLHIGTRRVYVSGLTAHPDRAWVTQQARNVAMW